MPTVKGFTTKYHKLKGEGIDWIVLNILFILYVIYSLSTIKHQLNTMSKHFNITEEESKLINNEEIE
ncbi:hypothetical protein [Alkalihalobacillus sp. TS-13]|uniref:hypothetical protein n=1 Tax=Alkalihalobacillus sp. TS-13 TaxID=2842455 RepID=UPI001C88D77E|nr:hypothetical protein [Alkalihalobacillus sp. TS-13]